jgi:Ca-activated chloride channel family protein
VHVSGLDIMVVLDVSNSMEVEDIVPNRLKKAKHLVKSIAERLKGDRMGAVAFAGSSFMACPLTTDLDYLVETLAITGPKMVTNQGTDIGIGLETARKALERGAEEARADGGPESSGPSSHVILLLSDGEDHEDGAVQAAENIKKSGIKFYVVGVGTEKGGPIPLRDDTGNLLGYKRDRSSQPIVSSFKPEALMEVASAGGGRYWNATVGEAEVEEILGEMGALNRSEYAERRYLVYEDRFQFPLALAVLLLLLEISTPARRLRRERVNERPETVVSPRAGAQATLLFLIGWMLAPTVARAATGSGQPPLDVYLENERGLKAFRKGDVEEAKRKFGAAQAKDPTRPELQYNQGVVQLQEGDLEGSIEAFSNAARSSGPDPALAGQSLFNLGAAQAKKGDAKSAIRSYLGAINEARQAGDESLEQDSRKNLELLVQQEQQQRKQQKNDKDNKDQKPKEDEQQKKDQENQGQGDQEKKDQQKQANRYKDEPKTKRFKSEKLSPDDAERVMAELAGKERELQAKLKQQHGNPSTNAKDW